MRSSVEPRIQVGSLFFGCHFFCSPLLKMTIITTKAAFSYRICIKLDGRFKNSLDDLGIRPKPDLIQNWITLQRKERKCSVVKKVVYGARGTKFWVRLGNSNKHREWCMRNVPKLEYIISRVMVGKGLIQTGIGVILLLLLVARLGHVNTRLSLNRILIFARYQVDELSNFS